MNRELAPALPFAMRKDGELGKIPLETRLFVLED